MEEEEQVKNIKKSRTAYAGHVTRISAKIKDLIGKSEHYQKLICIKDQLISISTKLKELQDELISLTDCPDEFENYQEYYFELNSKIIDLIAEIDTYCESFSDKNSQKSKANLEQQLPGIKSNFEKVELFLTDANNEFIEDRDVKKSTELDPTANPFVQQQTQSASPPPHKTIYSERQYHFDQHHFDEDSQHLQSDTMSHPTQHMNPVDAFIDQLQEGAETVISVETPSQLTVSKALQQELETRQLPPIDLITSMEILYNGQNLYRILRREYT